MSKKTTTSRRRGTPVSPRPVMSSPSGGTRWMWVAALAAAVLLAAAVGFVIQVSRSSGGGNDQAAQGFGHVHGLAVAPAEDPASGEADPASGERAAGNEDLYVATHHGLFRLGGDRTLTRVSRQDLDLMGFTAAGDGRFLASGHPGEHGEGPANLGLIESTDGGVTWTSLSLEGAADFHGLRAAHGRVYGYNSARGAFMVSQDRRAWEERSTIPMGSFVVSPEDEDTVLAVTSRGLARSTDQGRGWTPVAGAPAVGLLDWGRGAQVWGVDAGAAVWSSEDGGTTWERRGTLPGAPHALTSSGDTLYAAVEGDTLVVSTDGGRNWTTRHSPTAG